MIIVRVELHHATQPGKVTEIARMEIANDGTAGRAPRRNYIVRTLTGRSKKKLDRRVQNREGAVKSWPSEAVHVWHLIAQALRNVGYGPTELMTMSQAREEQSCKDAEGAR